MKLRTLCNLATFLGVALALFIISEYFGLIDESGFPKPLLLKALFANIVLLVVVRLLKIPQKRRVFCSVVFFLKAT